MAKDVLSKREFETLSHFRYQLRRFLRFSEEATHSLGITHLQYLLLLHIKGYQGREWATIGELAERLQSHHHGVVSLVSRCEKLGLVYRQQGKTDRREVEVHLTPEGEKTVGKLARLHRDELLNLQGIFLVPGAQDLAGEEDKRGGSAEKESL
ncbi:MAG: MarR family winged helix-turn-helix transcriptional regulator [Sulfuricella sp.]